MVNPRWRAVWYCVIAVMAIWAVAIAGYFFARSAKVTPEKVKSYIASTDLHKLTGEARARAIRKLADMLNSLSIEDRRRARLERLTGEWFGEMSEEEKGTFLEMTMPTGFKQMLTSFEQLPLDKRRRTIDDALRRLREGRARGPGIGPGGGNDTNGPPVLSEELQAKVRTIGLKALYSDSSAETKAELAPVLEELQKVMESGRPFRGK